VFFIYCFDFAVVANKLHVLVVWHWWRWWHLCS